MSMPKISVIVPVYNTELYLERALESILNQSLKEIEIICINDGSTDNSLKILKKYKKMDSRIKIIEQKNRGLSVVRNVGINISIAENIIFFDSDDTIDKDMLLKLYIKMLDEDADIVYTRCKYLFNDGTLEKESIEINLKSKEEFIEGLISNKLPPSASLSLIKKDLFLKNNVYYPENLYYEDLATAYKLFFFSKKISIVNESLYNYYRYVPSSISNRFTIKHVDDFITIMVDTKLFLQQNKILLKYKNNLVERFYQTLYYLLSKAFINKINNDIVLNYLWEKIALNCTEYFKDINLVKQIQIVYLTIKCSDKYLLNNRIKEFFLQNTILKEKILTSFSECAKHELGLLYNIIKFFEINKSKKSIYVYGAGEAYQKLKPYFVKNNLQIRGLIDRNTNLSDSVMNLHDVISLINSQNEKEIFIVIASEIFFEEIKDNINKYEKNIKAKINYVTINGLM